MEDPALSIFSRRDINVFAQTSFRNQFRKFGIKIDDRRRHMYVIGKTGMGKTTLLENMVLGDIYAGNGVGIVDPHGDFAEKIINYIPSNRINDVVYFNPSDVDFPIGFNILEVKDPAHRHLVASGLMSVFKKIWIDMWSARMEYILNNTILSLLEYPGSTLLGINRLLADKEYRKKVVSVITDPVVKAFWITEFAKYNDKYQQEAVAPIQNKIGQFLSASVMRNIVAQVKSTIDIRQIMDSEKIFIMNLSKGRIGEDSSRLLGGMLITKIQLAAMERVDMPEAERKDFFLYVDEFQNFATESFANILSEARKYHLSLIMAHQYIKQLDEHVADAVFGNVGTIVTFRVGAEDAEFMEKEFEPVFTANDIINLPKFHIYLKLMINGVASQPFSAMGMPPIGNPTNNLEKVVRISRERYALPRAEIEDKIMQWSGMGDLDSEEALSQMDGGSKKPKNKEVDIPQEQRHPYQAQCWKCLRMTDVPFPPDGKRPTYCRDCYPEAMREKQEGKPAPPPPPFALALLKEKKDADNRKGVSLKELEPAAAPKPQQTPTAVAAPPVAPLPQRPPEERRVEPRNDAPRPRLSLAVTPPTEDGEHKKRRKRKRTGGGGSSSGNGQHDQQRPQNQQQQPPRPQLTSPQSQRSEGVSSDAPAPRPRLHLPDLPPGTPTQPPASL